MSPIFSQYADQLVSPAQGNKRVFISTVSDNIDDYFTGKDDGYKMTAGVGFGYIVDAFHEELGDGFVAALGTAISQNTYEFKTAIKDSMKGESKRLKYKDRSSYMDRLVNQVKLPNYQIPLGRGLAILKYTTTCGWCMEDGALMAYNTLESFWPKMKMTGLLTKPLGSTAAPQTS